MGAAVALAQDSLAVEPGSQVATRVRIRNTGEVVDQFSFEALGPAAVWASFEPPVLSLLPDADGIAEVRFAPPRQPATRAGTVPFGVRVLAQEDPQGSAVAEGDLVVGRYDDIVAEVVPRTARGRTVGHHDLAVQNRGNAPLKARLTAIDPERRVRFAFSPPEALARPGSATVARVDVRPRRRFLRGASVTHVYTIRLQSADQPPIDVAGAFLQEPLIPKWVPRALVALAALVLAWLIFLRPTVQSAAKNAVKEQVNESSQLAASQAVAPALAAADERLANVEQAVGIAPGEPLPNVTTTTTRPGVLALGDPADARLAVRSARTATEVLEVPEDEILSVTDLFFDNSLGDKGRVTLLRDDVVLLSLLLDNFRDLDYHFVAPLVFPPESELRFRVECANNGNPPRECAPALTFTGLRRAVPEE